MKTYQNISKIIKTKNIENAEYIYNRV